MTTEGVATEPADAKLPPKLTTDIELAFEEEHANLKAEFANLEKRHADTYTRLERLQESYDDLLANSKETEQELESLKSSYDGDQADYIKSLTSQLQEANALIQNQEQQMEMDRETKESHQKELATLRPSAKRIIDLEDEVRELKIENESLSKKANITNNLQRKLQDQSGLQKDNADLRRRLDVLEENQKEFDRVHQQNVIQDRTIKEFEKKFVSYELQVVEQDRQRRLLDEEVRDRDFKIQKLLTQQQNDENFIRQLQETINLSNATGGSPPSPSGALTLEQELEQSDESTPNYTLEISRLKAENQLLKSNTAGTNNANLRIDLEEAERNRKRLEETIRDLTEKNTITQSQLNALISNSAGEKLVKDMDRLLAIGPLHILTDEFYRNEAVMSTRKLYIEANNELSAVKNKLADLQAQLSARDRELLTAKADCKSPSPCFCLFSKLTTTVAAIDQEEIDALADLKEANELVTSSLQNDLLLLQDKHKTLTAELEEKKSHLVDALLSKDRLIQDLTSLKERFGAANHDDQIEKARARSIIEEEEARKKKAALEELQEVSHGTEPGAQKPLSKGRKFLNKLALGRLYQPYTPKVESPETLVQRDEASLLALGHSAIRMGPPVAGPTFSPRHIPLPQSPAVIHDRSDAVMRSQNSRPVATKTDKSRSKPKNKKP